MNCYLITYDLLVPGRDYTGLYTQIKSYHFFGFPAHYVVFTLYYSLLSVQQHYA